MKSVLISIQPKWCELIASGKKTVEVRKTRPKLDVPFKCYIYSTKPKHYYKISDHMAATDENLYVSNGKVKMCNGFEFWADDIEYERLNGKVIGEFVCDRMEEFTPTEKGVQFKRFSALHDTCLTLAEIRTYLNGKIGYGWHISNLVIYDKPKELSEFCKCGFDRSVPLKRPPQSWCYVEEGGAE